jgi:hypothetical protein
MRRLAALGDVCLSCWNGLAAHETQLGKELAGQTTSLLGSGRCTPEERDAGIC